MIRDGSKREVVDKIIQQLWIWTAFGGIFFR